MLPEGDQGEKGGGGGHVFRTEGYEHRATSIKRVFTAALALPIGGIFISGIISYRAALSEVDERIIKNESVVILKKDVSEIKAVLEGPQGLKERVNQLWYVDNAPDVKKKGKK